MGKIRNKEIKKAARELLSRFPDKFSRDFEKNKASVNELNVTANKTLRNKIAGYVTRLAAQRRD